MDFVHLHVHSEYSMLDGVCRIAELPGAAKELGQRALAITDHGNMFGAVAFYKACRKAGVRPIIGCEVYVASHDRRQRNKDEKYHHLVLLCENEKGYRNLSKLISAGYIEGFYSKPRVDDELLFSHSEGLIALSGCISGRIPCLLLANDYEGAKAEALRYSAAFGKDNFYLEVQNHLTDDEKKVREGLIKLSEDCAIGLVATNDAHYIHKRDADIQAVLMCVQTASVLSEGHPLGFENDEFYLKSGEEMEKLFPDCPQALENTVKIANRCVFDFDFSKRHLPSYPLPQGENASGYLHRLAEKGLKKKLEKNELYLVGHTYEDYKFRMIYELMMIEKMGYCDYFLIVWDFVRHAKEKGIPVGPGRGSGAGSLVAYLIGITEIDSIRYDLLFERFLNPERVSMPDFDIDFCYDRRDEVIDYVAEKYGRDHVAQIAAFGTFGARAAVRDVGRVLGLSYADTDKVAKLIPHKLDMTISEALKGKELKGLYDESLTVRQLLDTAMAVEGMPRHITTHAAGVVITERPVSDYLPLTVSSGAVLTQYDMNTVAELGLLKFDFLALRYLTVIENASKMVRKKIPSFDVKNQPLDDEETYKLIADGNTEGLFQLESPGMKRLLVSMRPTSIDDLMIAIALYRPGPMDSIPELINARNSGRAPSYAIEQLKEILDGTSGCIVYQEQVMQIFRRVAGYSYGRADVIRRAMAKKHADELEAERDGFLEGAEKNHIDRQAANELFDSMVSFASYAFNKSHAAAYAIISYRTAYLKAHYPAEYMSALLSSVCGDARKTAEYILALEKRNIRVLPPDINESDADFTVSKDGVRFGLLGVKNVGVGFVENLFRLRREEGPYTSLENFILRTGGYRLNKSQLSSLIGAGAFDSFGIYRSRMLEGLEELLSYLSDEQRRNADGQTDIFSMTDKQGQSHPPSYSYPEIEEYPLAQRLQTEKELTGLWFSGHPLSDYHLNVDAMHALSLSDILSSFDEDGESVGSYKDGDTVAFCGMISKCSIKTSKAGRRFALLNVEDSHAEMELLIFENVLSRVLDYLASDRAVYVQGKLSCKEDEVPKVMVQDLLPLIQDREFAACAQKVRGKKQNNTESNPDASSSLAVGKQDAESSLSGAYSGRINTQHRPPKLYIKLTSDFKKDRQLRALISIFEGETPCIFYDPEKAVYTDSGKKVRIGEYLLQVMKTVAGEDHIVLK